VDEDEDQEDDSCGKQDGTIHPAATQVIQRDLNELAPGFDMGLDRNRNRARARSHSDKEREQMKQQRTILL